MFLEAFGLIIGYYIFSCLSTYAYAVVKTWEFTGVWNFKAENGYIGICKLPKWLNWIEFRSMKNV